MEFHFVSIKFHSTDMQANVLCIKNFIICTLCIVSTTWYGTCSERKFPLSNGGVVVFSLGIFWFGDNDTMFAYLKWWFTKELDFPFFKYNPYFASMYINVRFTPSDSHTAPERTVRDRDQIEKLVWRHKVQGGKTTCLFLHPLVKLFFFLYSLVNIGLLFAQIPGTHMFLSNRSSRSTIAMNKSPQIKVKNVSHRPIVL